MSLRVYDSVKQFKLGSTPTSSLVVESRDIINHSILLRSLYEFRKSILNIHRPLATQHREAKPERTHGVSKPSQRTRHQMLQCSRSWREIERITPYFERSHRPCRYTHSRHVRSNWAQGGYDSPGGPHGTSSPMLPEC